MPGATWNGRDLDRRLLVELDWPVWESTATQAPVGAHRCGDRRCGASTAARALRAEGGQPCSGASRSRRDHLLEAARDYYNLLAKQVDVHGTDGADEASVTREPDGAVELTLSRLGPARATSPTSSADSIPEPRDEVRLFLDGGDDRAVVRGDGKGPSGPNHRRRRAGPAGGLHARRSRAVLR